MNSTSSTSHEAQSAGYEQSGSREREATETADAKISGSTTEQEVWFEHARGRFKSDQKQLLQWRDEEREAVPDVLYHYTTVRGLRGILDLQGFWATDLRYLNDATEFTYAMYVINEVVFETLDAYDGPKKLRERLPTNPGFATGLGWIDVAETSGGWAPQPFVVCFCEDGDLLSQWRGYTGGESGYSLGLATELLSGKALSGGGELLPPKSRLRRIIYDPEVQAARVRCITETWLETLEQLLSEGHEPSELLPYPGISGLQEALAEEHLRFKHPAFAEEREWRIIKLVDLGVEIEDARNRVKRTRHEADIIRLGAHGVKLPPYRELPVVGARPEGLDVQFRETAVGLAPYVVLPLRGTGGIWTDRVPLASVRQGPTSDPSLAMFGLKHFLALYDYSSPFTEISVSDVPLRY